jgi:general secretion pathway protein K
VSAPLKRQRGVAVVTALLLTTLAVAIVASLFWQQQVQIRSMENQRLHLQTKWILLGALDFSRLILRQDGMDNAATTLDAVWATPVAETRLDQYIERERLEGENFDASVSGQIVDAQSRYNLTNLAKNRVADPVQVTMYAKLLQNLQLDTSLAQRTADAIAKTQPPPAQGSLLIGAQERQPNAMGPVSLLQVDDLLTIPGYSIEVVDKLRPFVVVLPSNGVTTTINVNTAPAEVLSLVADISMGEAAALVARRKQAYFNNIGSFTMMVQDKKPLTTSYFIHSDYFLVTSKVRLDRAELNSEALIYRKPDTTLATSIVWIRQN